MWPGSPRPTNCGAGRAAIDLVREWGGLIGYVRVAFEDEDFDVPETSRMGASLRGSGRAFHADSSTTAIDERIAPKAGDLVVRKTRVGAFSTTDLHEQLQDAGVDTLVLAGISTSGVVLSTVIEAHDLDYRTVVLADGCADTDPEVHSFLLENSSRAGPRLSRWPSCRRSSRRAAACRRSPSVFGGHHGGTRGLDHAIGPPRLNRRVSRRHQPSRVDVDEDAGDHGGEHEEPRATALAMAYPCTVAWATTFCSGRGGRPGRSPWPPPQ